MGKEDMKKLQNYFMVKHNSWKGIRNYMGLTNLRANTGRGDDLRIVELPDLFLHQLENANYGPCEIIVTVLRQGKRNQFGKYETSGTMRSKEIMFCSHSSMAFWFFYQFQLSGNFPTMDRSEDWYDMKLFPRTNEDVITPLSRTTHYRHIERAFKKCDIVATKFTHYFRGDSTRKAEQLGVSSDDRNKQGRWSRGSMENCYSLDLSEPSMRALAGFSPKFHNFFIARDVLKPPPTLMHKVFPEIDQMLQEEMEESKPNIAKLQFLKLLKYLRRVILQDACFLTEEYPNSILWKHNIFTSQEFQDFKSEMLSMIDTVKDPTDTSLREVLPVAMQHYESKLQDMGKTVRAEIKALNYIIKAQSREIVNLRSAVEKYTSKRRRLVFEEVENGDMLETPCDTSGLGLVHESTRIPPSGSLINFRMNRSVTTVCRLWEEWKVGINGLPSIEHLDTNGVKWRQDGKEKTFYCRRRSVITLVEEYAQIKGISGKDAAALVEEHRVNNNWTLDAMYKKRVSIKQDLLYRINVT